jgi:hypothetical protein
MAAVLLNYIKPAIKVIKIEINYVSIEILI